MCNQNQGEQLTKTIVDGGRVVFKCSNDKYLINVLADNGNLKCSGDDVTATEGKFQLINA
jgi:hypothetical protein